VRSPNLAEACIANTKSKAAPTVRAKNDFKDKRGVDLISDVLPFGRLWYTRRMPSRTQSGTPSIAADHITQSSAFTMWPAT
jgi:hypothetical protein